MKSNRPSEKGQAMVLLVLGMVVMLGFTALAIDGGMVYSERRHAQNAADSAALAGALQKANNQPDSEVLLAARNNVIANSYTLGQSHVDIHGPLVDFAGQYYLVTVQITATVRPTLAQFVFKGPLQNTVTGSARTRASQPPMAGYAIITMAPTCDGGSPLVSITGGGNSGGVNTYNGGIWLNARESATSPCSIDPPTSAHNDGITTDAGHQIMSVGAYNYLSGRVNGEENISPRPVVVGANGGVPITDPLAGVPEPVCTAPGVPGSGTTPYEPGSYSGSDIGPGIYNPGIYCIDGEVKISGQDTITGNGVVFYFHTGGMRFTGQGGLTLTGPTSDNCLMGSDPGNDLDPTASCTYKGIAIFAARDNTSTIEVRGNGADAIQGTVYSLNGVIMARGGGSDPDETQVVGQVIARRVINNGNGSLKVTYNDAIIHWAPPQLSLEK